MEEKSIYMKFLERKASFQRELIGIDHQLKMISDSGVAKTLAGDFGANKGAKRNKSFRKGHRDSTLQRKGSIRGESKYQEENSKGINSSYGSESDQGKNTLPSIHQKTTSTFPNNSAIKDAGIPYAAPGNRSKAKQPPNSVGKNKIQVPEKASQRIQKSSPSKEAAILKHQQQQQQQDKQAVSSASKRNERGDFAPSNSKHGAKLPKSIKEKENGILPSSEAKSESLEQEDDQRLTAPASSIGGHTLDIQTALRIGYDQLAQLQKENEELKAANGSVIPGMRKRVDELEQIHVVLSKKLEELQSENQSLRSIHDNQDTVLGRGQDDSWKDRLSVISKKIHDIKAKIRQLHPELRNNERVEIQLQIKRTDLESQYRQLQIRKGQEQRAKRAANTMKAVPSALAAEIIDEGAKTAEKALNDRVELMKRNILATKLKRKAAMSAHEREMKELTMQLEEAKRLCAQKDRECRAFAFKWEQAENYKLSQQQREYRDAKDFDVTKARVPLTKAEEEMTPQSEYSPSEEDRVPLSLGISSTVLEELQQTQSSALASARSRSSRVSIKKPSILMPNSGRGSDSGSNQNSHQSPQRRRKSSAATPPRSSNASSVGQEEDIVQLVEKMAGDRSASPTNGPKATPPKVERSRQDQSRRPSIAKSPTAKAPSEQQTQSSHSPRKSPKNSNSFGKVGDRVEGLFEGGDEWYSGRIASLNEDGTCHIIYDDGDEETHVPASLIRSITSSPDITSRKEPQSTHETASQISNPPESPKTLGQKREANGFPTQEEAVRILSARIEEKLAINTTDTSVKEAVDALVVRFSGNNSPPSSPLAREERANAQEEGGNYDEEFEAETDQKETKTPAESSSATPDTTMPSNSITVSDKVPDTAKAEASLISENDKTVISDNNAASPSNPAPLSPGADEDDYLGDGFE